jgi:DNA invertase Pin-like site-specific DNA recombinase
MKGQKTYGEKVADAGLRFVFYGRVSTEDNQDPTLSLPRQLANCEKAVAEAGGRVVAHFYDVESGAMRFDARGSGKGLAGFDIPIPRDGGLVELIAEASSGGFDAVVCESINRLSRNPSVTFRVEEQLADEGVRLWAIDEPFEESFGSIVLRHVNVGLARGYLHELKVKSRQGIETAAKQGRHAGGKALYGYRFAEHDHPNPHKAEQGVKVKVLEPDPVTAPVVKMIFNDYVSNGLSITAILEKLNADLDSYPPPQSPDPKRRTGMWGRSSVWEILHNPKYTGFMVWNRRQRKRGGKINPPEAWVWSEEPAHEALVSREMFDKANLTAIKRDNVTKAKDGHEDYRKHTYAAAVVPSVRPVRAADARQDSSRPELRVLHVRDQSPALGTRPRGPSAHGLPPGGQSGRQGRRVPRHASVRAGPDRGVEAERCGDRTRSGQRSCRDRAIAIRPGRHQEADPQAGDEPGGPGARERDRGRHSGPARGACGTEGEETAGSGSRREGEGAGSRPRVGGGPRQRSAAPRRRLGARER